MEDTIIDPSAGVSPHPISSLESRGDVSIIFKVLYTPWFFFWFPAGSTHRLTAVTYTPRNITVTSTVSDPVSPAGRDDSACVRLVSR